MNKEIHNTNQKYRNKEQTGDNHERNNERTTK